RGEAEHHLRAYEEREAGTLAVPYVEPCFRVVRAYLAGDAGPAATEELERLQGSTNAEAVSALRLLRALRDGPPAEAAKTMAMIAHDGSWFQVGNAQRVDCRRKPITRRVLGGLVEHLRHAPGASMDRAALCQAGWPGERMSPSSAKRRVEVMIARLRDAGLRGVLETTPEGYRLAPERARVPPEPAR
ncbi:MAG: helix-turn-helix domain-containing protein, partial [Myxococcota bacterium]